MLKHNLHPLLLLLAYHQMQLILRRRRSIIGYSGNISTFIATFCGMMMRIGDNMAMDIDSGELHIISSWEDEDEDD